VAAARHQFREVLQVESKYGGLEASDVKRLKELEHENPRLKRMYADLSLENAALKDVIAKTL
jgi:putative transposase